MRTPNFRAYAARGYGNRGYFSRCINGKIVRMWDFTDEQYQALINLCFGLNQLLPKIRLRIPYDKKRTGPLLTEYLPFQPLKEFLAMPMSKKEEKKASSANMTRVRLLIGLVCAGLLSTNS